MTAPPKPTSPFRPRTFVVTGPTQATATTRRRGPVYGEAKLDAQGSPVTDGHGRPVRAIVGWEQPGKTRACWDLTITCDGHRWYDRHYAAGRAQAAKEHVEEGFRAGLDFDPGARRFLPPADRPSPNEPAVFTESLA